jgi:DnaJ-class molecular chaperone
MINRLLKPNNLNKAYKHINNLTKNTTHNSFASGTTLFSRLRYSFSQNINFNPYTVLGVNKTASEKDIKKAYIKKVKESHPDVKKDDGKAFKQV